MTKLLEKGDIIELHCGHKVYTKIPETLVYNNRAGVWTLTEHEITIDDCYFSWLVGKYVVTKTSKDGGGTGMGPHDVYPNGHHVFCQRLKDERSSNKKIEVNFYQTGCFTAMIRHIEPIGKAKHKESWILDGKCIDNIMGTKKEKE